VTLEDDPRWRMVTCSRCGREYLCTPGDDWYEPDDRLGWTAGRVCLDCLWTLGEKARRRS